MLEALGRLKEYENLRCIIVGGHQGKRRYVRELHKTINRFGLEPVVQFTGNCRDMPAAFMLADVVVSASTEAEAFGRVIVEAQAMGRPVIAFDHGGARETILEGKTGWLAKPNDIDSLSENLKTALSISKSKRNELSNLAQSSVKRRFSVRKMTNSTLEIYRKLLLKKGFSPLVLGK